MLLCCSLSYYVGGWNHSVIFLNRVGEKKPKAFGDLGVSRLSQDILSLLLSLALFQSLIEAHDKVAAKCYEMPHTTANSNSTLTSSLMPADAVRMIGIQKKAGEPLVSYINCSSPEDTFNNPLGL